ncbi:Trp biosynthesis-associated membrane protein [Thermasporomyces composti]|jgi:uncharacterized membrane protein (TIGR02234 family)|uniref:Putative membrane protein (TIGR02234 family) n=1 Tax=Thermasporomyces composti TaxID=696763 RepID=A0A3D9UYZ9_THECX|nr:Trp biosynthesis-associated membrane protein [Thermasporomyces composti]REF34762.1 putative membrane protein (TIGR02234 family) [Thermasporomyces composti]
MTGRREMTIAALAILVGAVAVLLAVSQTWVTAAWTAPDYPRVWVRLDGGDASPVARACGYVALAGVVALVATRRTGRRIVGALLALAGLGVVVACGFFWWLGDVVADSALTHAAGESTLGVVASDITTTGWPLLAVAGGVLITGAGVWATARGPQWPALGLRYEAPTTRRHADDDPWTALDKGEDPTLGA